MNSYVPVIKQIDLGKAWSGNSINTSIFRHHGILTSGKLQFAAYYRNRSELVIIRRDLETGRITKSSIRGAYDLSDAHNTISLGIDSRGYLHISYGHHYDSLTYQRSSKPFDIQAWSGLLEMTGNREDKVTYPSFLVNPVNQGLYFLYRDGGAARGRVVMKKYDVLNKKWSDYPESIITGYDQSPWTSNPYWNHPAFDRDGNLHISYVWRTKPIQYAGKGIINNSGIDYAYSPDNGITWQTLKGYPLELPITQVNSERVWAVPGGANLINQTSMAVDGKGNPHIVYYANDENDIPQYQHLWHTGKCWKNSIISRRRERFILSGKGTLKIPISRPEIVIDGNNVVYFIYRADFTDGTMVAQALFPPDYLPGESEILQLWHKPTGFAEPVIDRLRWNREQILSMLLQYNLQPDEDLDVREKQETIYIVDWDLKEKYEKRF